MKELKKNLICLSLLGRPSVPWCVISLVSIFLCAGLMAIFFMVLHFSQISFLLMLFLSRGVVCFGCWWRTFKPPPSTGSHTRNRMQTPKIKMMRSATAWERLRQRTPVLYWNQNLCIWKYGFSNREPEAVLRHKDKLSGVYKPLRERRGPTPPSRKRSIVLSESITRLHPSFSRNHCSVFSQTMVTLQRWAARGC
jgi:hypothetical protein